ncbi:uncharacterized protein PGRI_085210 [Penicillium griseofulvum]|uniref:Fungal N-terminal domain-containing protein n=1 Tax=Penicillium patulum TaxID=5078 RepID=A0A135LTB9_PENPA|nr:uncharacterized protein PGRI_085210 [Penicillium griseofulvum]KXG52237.1 hypothetical protein PGRI_085210 [Penicillium griseofulvum]
MPNEKSDMSRPHAKQNHAPRNPAVQLGLSPLSSFFQQLICGRWDKMAEVIGIVSGAITFGTVVAQISKSIIQIKDCWGQIRDAPEDMQELIAELEIYDLILRKAEQNLSSGPMANAIEMNGHLFQSLEVCRKAAESLQIISKDLAKDLQL